jgi:CBS domain containing-hemolysin-like protein
MVTMDVTWPLERNLEGINPTTSTRYPLCEGDPDHVLGVIHIKDLLRPERSGGGDIIDIRRDILFVPEHRPIALPVRPFFALSLFSRFRAKSFPRTEEPFQRGS